MMAGAGIVTGNRTGHNDGDWPFVSVIIPVFNEAAYIQRCLQCVLDQDYPPDRYEIIIVDGASTDGTLDMVRAMGQGDQRIKLLHNARRVVPAGLNVGITAAHGDIIIRVDGHAAVAPDFIRMSVLCLQSTSAVCVGGRLETVGNSYVARGIALAMSTPFGVGSARFRYSDREGYVDTVAFATYRREIFDQIGLFDESLPYNEDDELNFRLRLAGGRIWMTPRIRSKYYSRTTFTDLGKQYFRYGRGKVRVLLKHRRLITLRLLIPPLFIASLTSAMLLGLLGVAGPGLLFLVGGSYVAADILFSLYTVKVSGLKYLPVLLVAYPILHVSYGFGFLAGLGDSLVNLIKETGRVRRPS